MIDRFNCLNVNNFTSGKHKCKAYQDPYRSGKDFCLEVRFVYLDHIYIYIYIHYFQISIQWLEKDFLGYLKEWEECVTKREELTSKERNNMLLSQEMRFGIGVTGKATLNMWLPYRGCIHICFLTFSLLLR